MKLEVVQETGTLQELNVKPGDVVSRMAASHAQIKLESWMIDEFIANDYYVVSRASTTQSPVRTVTKLEIVPGVYGPLEVYTQGSRVGIKWHGFADHADLTAAIETLQQIREAMDG